MPGRVGTGKITSHTAPKKNCLGLLCGLQTLYLHPALINTPLYRADRKLAAVKFSSDKYARGWQRMPSSSKQVKLIARIMFSCVFIPSSISCLRFSGSAFWQVAVDGRSHSARFVKDGRRGNAPLPLSSSCAVLCTACDVNPMSVLLYFNIMAVWHYSSAVEMNKVTDLLTGDWKCVICFAFFTAVLIEVLFLWLYDFKFV